MDDDVRKVMLIGVGAGVFFFGLWTLFLVFVALMAESGGKNSDPLTATLVLWPLAEVIWCWIWLFFHAEQYSNSKRRTLGNALLISVLLLPPLLTMIMIWGVGVRDHDWLFLGLYLGIAIVCCHGARWLWAGTQKDRTEYATGS
jgi:hypothetical protein